MIWTDEQIATLRTLWNDGLATVGIAWRIGVSKNAVIGKAHRSGLPARPSPIRGRRPVVVAEPAPRVTLPALASAIPPVVVPQPRPTLPDAPRTPPRVITAPVTPVPPPVVAVPPEPPLALPEPPLMFAAAPERPALPPSGGCQWQHGERGAYRACGAPAVHGPEGAVWCREHRSRVFVRDGRMEAAE